jgi:hypothetical protein
MWATACWEMGNGEEYVVAQRKLVELLMFRIFSNMPAGVMRRHKETSQYPAGEMTTDGGNIDVNVG